MSGNLSPTTRQGKVVGFVFYDPMYRGGKVFGYSANIVRCDEQRFGRLATAVHMEAMEKFKAEGKEVLNLLLAPFVKLDRGKYNDDFGAKLFFSCARPTATASTTSRGCRSTSPSTAAWSSRSTAPRTAWFRATTFTWPLSPPMWPAAILRPSGSSFGAW